MSYKRVPSSIKEGGVLRIVIPDLENICKEYLRVLSEVRESEVYSAQYDYVIIELIDQMTRTETGGEMLKYWKSKNADFDYVKVRTGFPEGYLDSTKEVLSNKFGDRVSRTIKSWKYKIPKTQGKKLKELGKFTISGEQHKWMYDEYSIRRLLLKNGFGKVEILKAGISKMPDLVQLEFNLDGSVYKPNCIYAEAYKS